MQLSWPDNAGWDSPGEGGLYETDLDLENELDFDIDSA
jgi:hypothetical protein